MKSLLFLLSLAGSASAVFAQSNYCVTSAVPPVVRSEGLTERTGDIVLTCTGTAGGTLTANFSVTMNSSVTNNVAANNFLTAITFTIDNGSGPQPVLSQPLLTGPNSLVFDGVPVTFSAAGSAVLRIAGIRVNATQFGFDSPIVASLAVNGAGLLLTVSQVVVGRPERGLYASSSATLICSQYGSPLPDLIGFGALIAQGTAFATTRLTEGIADAFGPRGSLDNLGGATGERFLITYSGLPADAQLFVPDLIAGSDAVQPTAGGDYGPAASGGAYAPSATGTLLLARVAGADSTGNGGGTALYLPSIGGAVFDSVSALPIVNGTAFVVYEVIDANPFAVESAQFPTFLGLMPDGSRVTTAVKETLFFAPASTVAAASTTEAVPRFVSVAPPQDCAIVGDCTARLPELYVDTTPLQFTAQAGGAVQQTYVTIRNDGAGKLFWSAAVNYNSGGGGWLSLDSYGGVNNTAVRVFASSGTGSATLAPGVYKASIMVTTGGASGGAAVSQSVPVTFTVTAAPPPPPTPVVTSVVNAASFLPVPVVPGSLTTLMGTNFGGANLTVMFDTQQAQILFSNATQINVAVPLTLGQKNSSVLTVTAGGVSSAPQIIGLAPFEPAIFSGAVVNQDGSINSTSSGAPAGSVIVIWATGLSGPGLTTGHIADRDIAVPYYAGAAPGLVGVQQVNLMIPSDLSPMNTEVYVCGASSAASNVCSLPAPLTIR